MGHRHLLPRVGCVRRAFLIGLLALVALAAVPRSAGAATVTLGATDLSGTGISFVCGAVGPSCISKTYSQTSLPEAGTVLIAPRDGVITSWRVQGTASGAGDLRLRVIRPAAGGQFTGAGTSAPATSLDGATPNTTSLPIQAGDYIGIDLRSGGTGFAKIDVRSVSGASANSWNPALPDNSTASPDSTTDAKDFAFEFNATVQLSPPVVAAVSPSSGPTAGGQSVTITGQHLAGASAVTFGSQPAASFSATNGQISATTPAAAAGAVDVRVTTPAGTSVISAGDRYTFAAPTPTVSGYRLSNSTFAAAATGGSIARKRAPVGTTVGFKLSEPATVRFKVERLTVGRKVKGRCVKSTHANRKHRSCKRYVALPGSFSRAGSAGANSFKFTGRLNGRKLRPGRYRLVAVAIAVGGNTSAPRRVAFRIVAR